MATIIPVPAESARSWNTLEMLKAGRAALLVCVALLLAAMLVGVGVHRDAMKTVGKDAAPSIISAQHIKAALADMDADAVDELLLPPEAAAGAVRAYEAKRVEAADALISAAGNITYGESERRPIQTLEIGMGTYERLIQKSRDDHAARRPEAAEDYREAARLLDESLLPAADALDQANHDVLERTYSRQATTSFAARAFVLLTALLALAAMVIVQMFLSRRTRRTFNPLLLLATLLLLGVSVWALAAMGEEQSDLKVAKEDAFTSIHALWRARALAYEAKSDESRSLYDPAQATVDQGLFTQNVAALATLPAAETATQVVAQLGSGGHVRGLSGYLADELNNITFSGERDAALATFDDFETYVSTDAEVDRLERGGQIKQALEMSLGPGPAQSEGAFALFDRSLEKTLSINQTAFNQSVQGGLAELQSAERKASVTAVLIAVLIFLGFAPRIREYE